LYKVKKSNIYYIQTKIYTAGNSNCVNSESKSVFAEFGQISFANCSGMNARKNSSSSMFGSLVLPFSHHKTLKDGWSGQETLKTQSFILGVL